MPPCPECHANPNLVKKRLPVYEICYRLIFNYPFVWLKCI